MNVGLRDCPSFYCRIGEYEVEARIPIRNVQGEPARRSRDDGRSFLASFQQLGLVCLRGHRLPMRRDEHKHRGEYAIDFEVLHRVPPSALRLDRRPWSKQVADTV